MDSNRLRYFIAVAETGSVRKAAELLRLSPAALSKAIKLLERESGLELLVPAGRGIAVTPDGRQLAKRAGPILENLRGLAAQIGGEKAAASDLIRLGSFEVFTTHSLKPVLKTFPREASLLLREVIPGEMENALLAHEIDVGITYLPIPTAGVDHLKVANVRMGIYARRGAFERAPFAEIPFAIPVQPLKGTPSKVQGLDGWPDGKVARHIKYQVTLMESALELCRNGLAAAYLPSFVVHYHNQSVRPELRLQERPLPKGIGARHSQGVYIARRKGDPEDHRVRRIARALREACSLELAP